MQNVLAYSDGIRPPFNSDFTELLPPERNHAKITGFNHTKIGSGNTSTGSFIGS